MRSIIKILIAVFVIFIAFLLWPGSPSFSRFSPERLTQSEIQCWRAARANKWFAYTWTTYWTLSREFHFSPTTSFAMSRDYSRAQALFTNAKNDADRKQALFYLRQYYQTAKNAIGSQADFDHLADIEFSIWTQAASGMASRQELAQLSAELWAALAGGQASSYLNGTRCIVDAALAYGRIDEKNILGIRGVLAEGYTEIKKVASAAQTERAKRE